VSALKRTEVRAPGKVTGALPSAATPGVAGKWIVRLSNGIAVRFYPRGFRDVFYGAVADEEATTFEFAHTGVFTAEAHGMRKGTFKVERLTTKDTNY